MRHLRFAAVVGALCLPIAAFAAGAPPTLPATLLVHVGWDGADFRRVSQLEQAGELPNLSSLAQLGSLQLLQIVEVTQTRPSWATQLTGLAWNVHETIQNVDYRRIPTDFLLFENLSVLGIHSVYLSGKCNAALNQGNMCLGVDPAGQPYPWADVPRFTDSAIADKNLSMGQITQQCLHGVSRIGGHGYSFCHYAWPDRTGHQFGGQSAEYDQSLRDLDTELGTLVAGLPSGTVVLLTSDHGFEKAGDPGEAESDPPPRIPDRILPFPFDHVHEPNAMLAANVALSTPATGRDVFKTIVDILGVKAKVLPRAEGRSLVPATPLPLPLPLALPGR